MLNNFWGKLATLNDTSHNSTYLVYPKKRILLNNTLTEHCIFSALFKLNLCSRKRIS